MHDVKLDSRSLAQSVNEVTFSFVPMYHSFVVSSIELVVNTPTTATFGVLLLQAVLTGDFTALCGYENETLNHKVCHTSR